MIVCAVPVKDLVNAKQRLVPALEPTERRELARAMLSDVLAALRAARLDGVWVVTRDPEVVGLAAAFGAEPLADRKSTRLNSSHGYISYAVFCLKKKKKQQPGSTQHRTRAQRRQSYP